MEFTLKTVLEFLGPLLEVKDLDPSNIFSITFEPGGIEVIQYDLNEEGEKIIIGGNIKMKSEFINYLA